MKIKVIVNPKAGRRIVQKNLESIVGRLLVQGIAEDISVTITKGLNDALNAAAALRPGEYDLLIVCGGDGTVNEVVNGLMESDCRIPLAILAAGTSNDFAVSLGLPQDPDGFCDMVEKAHYEQVDVGKANGYYFINVAAFGMFTEVAHKTDREAKGTLGQLAYYLKGIDLAPSQILMNISAHIKTPEMELDEDIRLFVICNSTSAGMVRRLFPSAEVSDGKFDVLIMKRKNLLRKGVELLPYITSGEFLKDPAIFTFRTNHIEVSTDVPLDIEVDLDGEYHGHLPLTVEVCHQALTLLMPEKPANTILPPIAQVDWGGWL